MADQQDPLKKYFFLHSHIAKEAHIFEVLDEISSSQANALRDGTPLATIEALRNSRNIKLQFNPLRNKTIAYLLDLLLKTYPEEIKKILTFDFKITEGKKLIIDEIAEFCILLDNSIYHKLQDERDLISQKNLLNLLKQYRLFNLTKLIKKASNKQHLSKIIKSEVGKSIFTFKNYTIERNNYEKAEDLCFHNDNYDAVKKSLNVENLKKIIAAQSVQIARRLKKFGILNADFTDYRDSKVDYLLNILIEDIPTHLTDKDLAEVKNFASLRTCLQKVDKIIDPIITYINDIVKFIKENKICTASEIIAVFDKVSEKSLLNWSEDNQEKYKIILFIDENNTAYLLDSETFIDDIYDLYQMVILEQERLAQMTVHDRKTLLTKFNLLCNTGKNLLSRENQMGIISSDENQNRLEMIIKDYEDFQQKITVKHKSKSRNIRRKKSFIVLLVEFFSSLFGGRPEDEDQLSHGESKAHDGTHISQQGRKKSFSKETKNLYEEIKVKNAKLLPLSDFMELNQENNYKVDVIIDELRGNNLKIVIPIFNARSVLYPKRSQKYIISDVEYLMVDPTVLESPETIRVYTDSLSGYKIKNEPLPPKAIMAIEKYLLTLYRQKNKKRRRINT